MSTFNTRPHISINVINITALCYSPPAPTALSIAGKSCAAAWRERLV